MENNTKYKKIDELVSRAMKGDKKSFEKLCKMEAAQIIYSCTKLMRSTLDGEDAAQEVFISMQRRIHTLKAPEAFVSWVQKMIYYICINMRQKNMNSANTLPIEEFADLFSETDSNFLPEEYMHEKEKSKELMKIIDNLPDQIRTCILMHYFNEMKIFEIADVLEISEGSVKGYLYVGREKLRKALKESNPNATLHSAALLPMAAVSHLFRSEMQEIITPKVVNHCLSSAGITTFPSGNWFALPAIKNVAIAAACTVVAAGSLYIYSSIPSNSSSIALKDSSSQQTSFMQASTDDNSEPDHGILPNKPELNNSPSKVTETSAVQNGATVGTSSDENGLSPEEVGNTSSSQPSLPALPPPVAMLTAVNGSLAVKNAESINNPDLLFDKQYYATIEQDGNQLALTMIDSKGQFFFDNLSIIEKGTYTLCVKNIYSHGFAFSAENPSGTMELELTPGKSFKIAQPLWVEDNSPPVVAVSMLDENGKQTSVNPAIIQINVYDATKFTIGWKILTKESGEEVKRGSSEQVESSVINELQEGYYLIDILVSDALGNETTVSGAFYTVKR